MLYFCQLCIRELFGSNLDLVIVEGSPVKMHAIMKMASLIRVPNSVGAKVMFAFAMVFGETLCGRFLLKFWRKRTRLPCMGPTESLYTLSPVVLAKVSVAQAFWRKILHIFTTGVGELFAHFRQSFWRNHLLALLVLAKAVRRTILLLVLA